MNELSKQLADELNKIEYDRDFSSNINKALSKPEYHDLVVATGESDDRLAFYSAKWGCEEYEAWDGGEAFITSKGYLSHDEDLEIKAKAHQIIAAWNPYNDIKWLWESYSWEIRADTIPYANFTVMEGANYYCKAIVFHIDDITPSGWYLPTVKPEKEGRYLVVTSLKPKEPIIAHFGYVDGYFDEWFEHNEGFFDKRIDIKYWTHLPEV